VGENPHDDGAIQDHRDQPPLGTTDRAVQDLPTEDSSEQLMPQVTVRRALSQTHYYRAEPTLLGYYFITPHVAGTKHPVIS